MNNEIIKYDGCLSAGLVLMATGVFWLGEKIPARRPIRAEVGIGFAYIKVRPVSG